VSLFDTHLLDVVVYLPLLFVALLCLLPQASADRSA